MVATVGIAGLELDGFLPPQAEGGLQAQAHANVGVGDHVQPIAQFLGLALVGHIAAVRDAHLGVVRWQDACLADFLCPPAQVCHAVFERASRQTFGLPALQQGFDMLALERDGPHLAKARFAQLACDQVQ